MDYLLRVSAFLGISALILFLSGIIYALVGALVDQIRERKTKKLLYNLMNEQIKKDYKK